MFLMPIPPTAVVATISFTASATSSANLTTYTFSSQAIGVAAADRKIVVAVTGGGAAGVVSTVTVGGVSATLVLAGVTGPGDPGAFTELWQADVPTGATADVVVTFAAGKGRAGIGVWAVYGAAAAAHETQSDQTLTSDDLSITIAVPAGGVCIAAVNNDAGTVSFTNLTEDYDDILEGAVQQGGASDAFSAAQAALVVTATFSSTPANNYGLLAVSFDVA